MQTNASFVRISLVAIAGVLVVACAGPSSGPTQKPQPGTSGGAGGTGGGGSGGTTGTGGNGGTTGTGGGDGTPDGGTTTPAPDGGVTTASLGCAGYVACLSAAMSDADAMKCDSEAKSTATSLLDAVDTCVGAYCLGMSGTAARCKKATDGSMQ